MRLVQVITDYIRRAILTTQGDLVVRGAAQPERLASGALDTYLRGKGAGVIPAYEAEPTIPAMRATLSANQSVPTSTWTKINFDGTDYDTTSDFDVVNHKWVCSEAGIYLIVNNLAIADLLADRIGNMIIKVNGNFQGGFVSIAHATTTSLRLSSNDILSLSVNDYVELFVFHTHGANRNIIGGLPYGTYLAIHNLS